MHKKLISMLMSLQRKSDQLSELSFDSMDLQADST